MGLRRLALAALLTALPFGVVASERAVAPGPDALSLAIASALPGDVLVLGPGDYAGPVTIDRSLTIEGAGATVTGSGTGSVVLIDAPGVTIRGLGVTGSGAKLEDLDSGIFLTASADGAIIEGNRLERNLIGINVHGAANVIVRGNDILGRNDLRVPERGPGVYVWNAPNLLVEDNAIRRGRDGIFISSSSKATYRGNDLSELRYAFHSMYANDIQVEGNVSRGNDLGFAFMYSTRVTAVGNLSEGDVTHGFFMNFANRSTLIGNEVRDGGEKCLFIYNSNRNFYEGNRLEGCDIGVHFTAGSEGNVMSGNAFINNRTQVKYVGTRWLEWSQDGRGNYWSDHAGFDIDGDGTLDSPYRPNDVIDKLIWSQPMVRLLTGAPAMQLVSWSQARFPGLTPGGVVDSYPMASPAQAGLVSVLEGDTQ